MSEGWLRRKYVERHAAKGEDWAIKNQQRERENAARTPVWVRATIYLQENSNYGIVGVQRGQFRTIVFNYTGDPKSASELERQAFPHLHRFNKSPSLDGLQFQAVNFYETESAAHAGAGAPW